MTDKEFLKDIHSLLDNNEINGTWLYEIGVENQETGEIMGGFLSLTPPKQHLNEKMVNQYWLSAIDVVTDVKLLFRIFVTLPFIW